MCGIIGIASNKSVSSAIINSLRKLEYRGYDSAGIATLSNGIVSEAKSEGRVDILEKNLAVKNMSGPIGIGHVRWATHGIPNTINAHPHSSESVSVVHNGIIENSTILKKYLINKGHVFKSQTDTEVIVHLITEYLKELNLKDAIIKTLKQLHGSFALGIIFKDQTDLGLKLRKDIDRQGTVNEEDINEIIDIYRGLTMVEFSEVHEVAGVHWLGKTFDHSPSVAAIASLTSLEMKVLSARAHAVSVLRARVGGGEYSFNKVMPLAYGPEVVNSNEEFEVEILMAAFDTDKQPEVIYNGEKVAAAEGKARLKLKGTSGTMELKGTVAIQKKNGDMTKRDWTKTVTVMKPSGSIELPEMNVLYRGYANKVNATASGYPETSLSGSGVSVSRSGEGYIVKPAGRAKTATLSVSGRTADGKSVSLKTMTFRCSNLPDPELYWGGVKNGGKASKTQTTLFAKYPPEIPLNAKFSIVKWECQVPGAMGRPPSGPGGNISAASNLLRAAKSGSQVSFICTVVGPDGIQRKKAGAFKI